MNFNSSPENGSRISIFRREPPVSGTIRILIVDDHAVVRQGLSNSLKQEPDIAIVGEAADGEMAIEKARDLQPDIILMDLGLPKMNGIEATRRIHSEIPGARVIGLSMFEEKERAAAMFEAGAVAYLHKTCGVDALTSTIRRCSGRPGISF
jgi:DNA-binding NarL/FixJ family response regulator